MFGVNHYSGSVSYQINDFIEKNRDHFGNDLLSLIESSRFRFLHRLFENKDAQSLQNQQYIGSTTTSSGNTIASIRQTLGLRFRRSLESLMNRLDNRRSYFVCCIKSNDAKKPMVNLKKKKIFI